MQARDESGTVRSVERALSIVELLGEHDSLGLDSARYTPVRLETADRVATGPDGETLAVTDTVVVVRRTS